MRVTTAVITITTTFRYIEGFYGWEETFREGYGDDTRDYVRFAETFPCEHTGKVTPEQDEALIRLNVLIQEEARAKYVRDKQKRWTEGERVRQNSRNGGWIDRLLLDSPGTVVLSLPDRAVCTPKEAREKA